MAETTTKDEQSKPKRCGAKNRPGAKHARCQAWALPGRTRCGKHGGLTPKGPDSVHWRGGFGDNGKARKALPDLNQLLDAARRDPELMLFREDVAILEAARRQVMATVEAGKPMPAAKLKQLLDIGENIRRVKESEHRRLVQLNQTVSAERHRRAMAMTGAIVAEVVIERIGLVLAALTRDTPNVDQAVKLLNAAAWTQDMARRYRLAALREPTIVIEAGGAEGVVAG